jgi:flagellar M-ring protein FliF
VILTLKRNRPLGASTIAGIVNLVAFSVEGLRPEAVVLIDNTGRPLSRPTDDTDEPLSAAVMERQEKMERELAGEVVRMIEPIVGAERVRANVTLRLNTKTQEETSETFDPATVIRSRQVTLEGAAANAASGIAGARGNLPGQAAPAPAATPVTPPGPPAASLTPAGGNGRQAETVNYEVGKKTTHSLAPRGDVARLSVAVVVDNARQSKTDAEGKVTKTSTPRPQAEMQKIQQLVAAAVGLDANRGDQLIVENVSFDEPIEEPVVVPTLLERVGGGAQTWARPAIVLVVGLVALLFVLRPIVRGVFSYAPPPPPPAPTRAETQPLPRQLPKTIEEVEHEIEAELDAKVADHMSNRKTPILQKRVAKAIETEPENAARLIRAWLSQEEA